MSSLKQNRSYMRATISILIVTLWSLNLSGQSPDNYLLGKALEIQKKNDSALIYFNRAVESNPGNVDLLYTRGKCYFDLQKYANAYDDFFQVERRQNGMASFYLARTEVHLQHPEQAIKYLRIHLSSRYKLPEKDILLNEELSSLDNRADWKALWNERKWYSQYDMDYQEALFLLDNGSHLDAINVLNRLEKSGYNKSEVLTRKAEIYETLGNKKAVMSEIDKAVKSNSRNITALNIRAKSYIREGKYEEALADCNRLIRMDPASFDTYLLRSNAKSEMGDLGGAVEDIDNYLIYFPRDDSAYFIRGTIQYKHSKYLNAIQSLNKALELNTGKAEYYHYRGLVYAKTGTLKYAEKDLSMALDLDPVNGETWFEKGKIASRMGKIETACHDYKKAYQYGVYEARDFLDKKCTANE